MFSLHEKYQLDDGDVSVPFLLVVLSSLFNVNWYRLPPGGSYLKASSPKGLKAWSWQEFGVCVWKRGWGGLLNKAQLFLLQLSTFHQWTSYSVSCCQGSLTIAVAILRATSKTPYTPPSSSGTTDLWETPETLPHQSRGRYTTSLRLFC